MGIGFIWLPLGNATVLDPLTSTLLTLLVVLVCVNAVNFVDGLFVQGLYQIKPPTPFVPGGEVAGVVTEVGEGVDTHRVGDRVFASTGLGGFASEVVVPAHRAMWMAVNRRFDLPGKTAIRHKCYNP